ncbi:hypothetical protein NK553_19570 [Pseudomonas sp. ZM23]|uniref:Lipoprotein n=1 Tax=Pseudomonas triclosanedens TaxID=2961893 RepID=A0ABY6ZQY7_9PSED|nr:hypothetical protein [Pseudomonas triclosanedens]MCP8466157.1 hypothetical protein [Pseudomonas triclosanedens]MCP8472392.1 hypothetical protein [Pseudomonas triclosanedens]MCP8477456.1 hypothetical protein [Pseudomonas triclosanedens]WAI47211.1 hypothetical protein OU419_15645 [Pseudomonas triclosanedens]
MSRFVPVLLAGALAVVLGGSSCNSHNDAPPPPPMGDSGQIGYKGIPQQQIQPRVQSIVPR